MQVRTKDRQKKCILCLFATEVTTVIFLHLEIIKESITLQRGIKNVEFCERHYMQKKSQMLSLGSHKCNAWYSNGKNKGSGHSLQFQAVTYF